MATNPYAVATSGAKPDPFRLALGGQTTPRLGFQAPAPNAFAAATTTPMPLAAQGGMNVYNPATAYTAPRPVTPVAPVTAISASNLTPQPTPVYPTVQSNPATNTSLQASLAAIQEQALGIQSQLQKDQTALQQNPTPATPVNGRGTVLDRILGFSDTLAGKGDFTNEVNKENDIAGKAQQVTDLTNQYKAKERAYDLQIRDIQKNNAKGIGAEVAQSQIADIQRNKNQELADIAIQQSAALGNYDTAREIAQQTVDAKYEPIQEQIQLLKDYYQLSADDLTESEKLQAQEKIQERQAAVDFDRQKDMYKYKQEIDQQDPLYQANLANVYSQIASRNTTSNPNGTISGKPQTASQAKVNGYADRLSESGSIVNSIGDKFASLSAFGGVLPNFLQGAERQQFEQAKRNFVNATLRQESGASIAPSEFLSADRQYFPQPGDSPEVLVQKAQNRNTVINSFYREANVPRPVGVGDVVESDGIQYRIIDEEGNVEPV